MPWTDADLERLYVYAKALMACLPTQASGGLELGSDLVLTHLRLEETGTAQLGLSPGEIEAGKPFPGEGHPGGPAAEELDSLAAVIAEINDRFGAELDESDRLEFEKIKMGLLDRDDLKVFANANTEENYALEFGPVFKGAVLDQEERNRRLFELLLSKPALAEVLERELMRETYRELRDERAG